MQISIIVPIYQVEAYLEECLQSLVDQTHKNLDIVLIDDGSIDKSLDIAMHYVRLDQRFFLITKPSCGPSAARNMGLELIKGTGLRALLDEGTEINVGGGGANPFLTSIEKNSFSKTKTKLNAKDIAKHFVKLEERIYKCDLAFINDLITQELPSDRWIHFLDSDDYFRVDCLQRCYGLLREFSRVRSDIEVVIHGMTLYHEDTGEFASLTPYAKVSKALYARGMDYLVKNDLHAFYFVCDGVFRTEILNRYGLRFSDGILHEDHDFGTILFALARGVLHDDFDGLVYRQRSGSIMDGYRSGEFPKKMSSNLEALKGFFDSYRELRLYFRAYSFLVVAWEVDRFIKGFVKHEGISKRARRLFRKSIRFYIHDYVYNYSSLDGIERINQAGGTRHKRVEGLLKDMGIEDIYEYKRMDTRRAYWEGKYEGIRYCWRHPVKA